MAIGFALLCALAMTSVMPISGAAQTLDPGIMFEVTEHADSMEYINYSWSVTPANASIHFVVLNPSGDVLVDNTTSSYNDSRLSPDSGVYIFRWTNNETYQVELDYNITSEPTGAGDTEHIFDTVFLGLIVGAVVVVITVVLVVAVTLRNGRRTPPRVRGTPAQRAPPGEVPSPYVPGMCPRCGSPFDSQHTFCPKCGHRVR